MPFYVLFLFFQALCRIFTCFSCVAASFLCMCLGMAGLATGLRLALLPPSQADVSSQLPVLLTELSSLQLLLPVASGFLTDLHCLTAFHEIKRSSFSIVSLFYTSTPLSRSRRWARPALQVSI